MIVAFIKVIGEGQGWRVGVIKVCIACPWHLLDQQTWLSLSHSALTSYPCFSIHARKIGNSWSVWWSNDDVSANIFASLKKWWQIHVIITSPNRQVLPNFSCVHWKIWKAYVRSYPALGTFTQAHNITYNLTWFTQGQRGNLTVKIEQHIAVCIHNIVTTGSVIIHKEMNSACLLKNEYYNKKNTSTNWLYTRMHRIYLYGIQFSQKLLHHYA